MIDYDRLLFAVGDIQAGMTGSITLSGQVKSIFGSSDVTNSAQIYSLVDDPNPLNNNSSASALISDAITEFGGYIINPLLTMKSLLERYSMIIQWLGTEDTVFRDILPGHERYMHIMTVARAGIINGYKYKYATMFSPKKCTSYVEGIIVAGKIMHMRGDDSVYSQMYDTTPFADANFNVHVNNFINR